MTIYSVVATAHKTLMEQAIQRNYGPLDYFRISDGVWFVSSAIPTPRDLGQQLAPNNECGTFLITSISGYYGFYAPDLWDWLKSKGL